MLQPPSPGSFIWFSLICSRRGGSTTAVVKFDTVVDESRTKMADSVTRSPARLSNRDGKLCHYGRLEYGFLAFVLCFLRSLFSPSLSRYVSLLRVPSSVQQSSCTLQQEVRVLPSCVICIRPHLGIALFLFKYFFVVFILFLGWPFCCAPVPGTLALLTYMISRL